MENRNDGMIIFDDQVCEMVDHLLSQDCVRLAYKNGHDRSWIRFVGDENLRDELLHLNETQLRIIEGIAFDGVGVVDLRRQLGLSAREIRMEAHVMRDKLIRVM